jgi:hypothetical protein
MIDIIPPTVVDIHKPPKRDRPEFDVYIGRAQPYPNVDPRAKETSKWHNPFTAKEWGERALVMYEVYITFLIYGTTKGGISLLYGNEQRALLKPGSDSKFKWDSWNLSELTGMRLGCWCITTDSWENPVCHGQILMKLWHEAWERGELDE